MALNLFAPVARAWAALRTKPEDPQQRVGGFWPLGATTAGVRVSPDSIMQVDAAWACIDVIASAAASSDWNVYSGMRGADRKQALPYDRLQYVLNTRPNPECTAQSCKRALMIAAVGYGNGYAEIERDMAGRIVGLWPIAPDRVEPRRDLETGNLFYRVYPNGTQDRWIDLEQWEMFHIRGAGLLGSVGDSVLSRAVQSIAQAIAIDQFGQAYFGNHTQLGTILIRKSGTPLKQDQHDQLMASMEQRHKGAKKSFSTAILSGGDWDIKQIGTDADKAQLIEAKHLSIESICRWFRVPPHKIAHLLRATNNNIEHQGLEFTRDTMRPWVKEIEQECDYKLIPGTGPSKFIEIDVDWAEQGDYKSRMEAYAIGLNTGVFSPNDVLRKLGENTIGALGDIRYVQGANVRLEDVGAAYNKQSPAQNEDAEDDPDELLSAWLTNVYQRIQSRFDNRAHDLQQAGRTDWLGEARAATVPYALQQVGDMRAVLGERLTRANEWAIEVINGCEPRIAAQAALEKQA